MLAETNTQERREGSGKKPGPERTCAGCGKHATPAELVRVVLDPSPSSAGAAVAVDLGGSVFGRGAYVHPAPACVLKAIKGGFSKSFKTKVSVDPGVFGEDFVRAADRRIEGLLSGARRGRLVVVGADSVKVALQQDKAELVVVARDAAAAARIQEVESAISAGTAIAWSEKLRLGALFGRDEVAVCALLHPGLAAAVSSVYRASRPFAVGAGSQAAWWSEVR